MSIFSSNKEKQEPTPTPTPTSQPVQTTPQATTYNPSSNMTNISKGTIVDGQMRVEGDVKIDGIIKGTVTSKGKVVLSSIGKVEGDIICQNSEISGYVTGKLKIADVLMLKGNAVIDGDINTGKLMIEAGVKFNGNCTMGASGLTEQNTPKVEPPKTTTIGSTLNSPK